MRDTITAAVLPAAGRGTRFGSPRNKIWTVVAGKPMLEWSLAAFQQHPEIDAIVVAASAEDIEPIRALAAGFDKVIGIVEGGPSRQESVANGLAALPSTCQYVLVHDAARPAVSQALISRVLDAVMADGAAVPGLPVTDSIRRVDGGKVAESVRRDGLVAVQTPQGARVADLRAGYRSLGAKAAQATDEAEILSAAGYPVTIVQGDAANIKVTHPNDIARVELELRAPMPEREKGRKGEGEADSGPTPNTLHPTPIRTGFGYDVHPFAEGRDLWLGGVRIPNGRGLAGHSDADALLHALCDALLGAAGMGDIGMLFPDTDAAHKDRASIEFLNEVVCRLDAAGWQIINVDVALLAEEPRIGPHRERMIAVIADGLRIAPTQVNIKATTSEGMGFVGRREGIACWAVATIGRLPGGSDGGV